ncbi:hypothetical protein [Cupriavidus oxalaticus]|uniref:Chromosome partition protein Smc n=1 Tax=Cupriavidus oxalaticus TaxID=96344 RepID=A0A4P7LV50_9BURK|nr:hypothetical protein [Cupriavidus oxalaticus]QBY56351.1 hypothetical protein E0W60_35680 [Cupriavidus oxalaticus]
MKKKEEESREFNLVDPKSPNAMRELVTQQLGHFIDAGAIGRIVQAAQEIELSRKRILAEHTAIGSRLFQIYHSILTCVQKRLGDTPRARQEADDSLYALAVRGMRISRASVIKYLQAFHHFSENHDALTFLNLGELTILKRSDITNDEVQRFIDARKNDESYSRKEILPYIEWTRRTHQDLNHVMATLEAAEEQLNESLERQRDLEAQMRHMREQMNSADALNAAQKEQLDRTSGALTSQQHAMDSLQLSIKRLNDERQALQKALAESKIREVVREVKVEVVPVEYKNLADAVIGESSKLDATKAQVKDAERRLAEVNAELEQHEAKEADSRSLALRIDGLKADLDDALAKLRSSVKAIKAKEHGAALLSLRRSAEAFHNELVAITGA